MRYRAEHKPATRARILAAAMTLLTQEGPHAVTVHGVMRAANLSHGGFYAHFESRDALLGAAFAAAAERTLDAIFAGSGEVATPRSDLIGRYLGRAHLEAAVGCPLPAACGGSLEGAAADARRRSVQRYRQAMTAAAGDDSRADALLALMVGGVALARALGGEDGEAVLRACRRAARALD